MSSLVFVRDAQGRPLMPMSAAYARTLMKQGKAQVWPHPAFSVIQLTRTVATPILRPVLVGLALSTRIADLVIVIDQLRSAPSTIQISVDLRFPPLRWGAYQGQWQPRRRRIPFTQAGSLPRPADHVSVLKAVLRAFHTIIPISHLVFLPSARRTALTPPHAWWSEHRLTAGVRQFSDTITIVHQHTHLSGEAPRALTHHLIERTIWAAREAPQLVACVPDQQGRLSRQAHPYYRWQERGSPGVIHTLVEPHLRSFGQLCTVRHQGRTLSGAVRAIEPPDQLVLAIPVQVDDQGVQWQSIRVRSTSSLHVWPSTPIWLLPLARQASGGHHQQ